MSSDALFHELGQAGLQLTALGAAEGAAGNISVFTRRKPELPQAFSLQRTLLLPAPAPALAGGWVVVKAAGRRLRDIAADACTALVALHILPGGSEGELYAAGSLAPSSELNSHLAVHNDQVERRGVEFHAVVHAQPFHVTFLSHISRYNDTGVFTRRLFRWEPETILVFPEGVAMLPFEVPGSVALMAASVQALRTFRLVVWQKHGVLARSDAGVVQAADLVEYIETAAHYEALNLQAGEPAAGLSEEELKKICRKVGVPQSIY